MDESLITQSDGTTQAKRPRVVIAGDQSGASVVDPIKADPGSPVYSVPVLGSALVDEARPGGFISGEIRPMSMTTDGRVRVSSSEAAAYMDMFGDTSPIETDPRGYLDMKNNPWGI